MELCLGTVQLGMDYGIAGQKRPSVKDSLKILDYATQNEIKTIDTANSYGTAEDVVGEFLKANTIRRNKLEIISKLKPNVLDNIEESKYYEVIKDNLMVTLRRLGTEYLDGYLLHSSRYIFNDAIIEALYKVKKDGFVKQIGVSVYEVNEAKKCIERPNIDFMQLPYSIFDQRMLHEGIFDLAKSSNITIHSRSAFIQGLISMKEDDVPEFLNKARPIISKIDKLCEKNNISRIELAISFVKRQSAISRLVFGVDNLSQLKEDIDLFKKNISDKLIDEISKEFVDVEPDIVMPSLWKK